MEDLSGWRLTFFINYVCTDFIGVDKKFRRYPSDRELISLFSDEGIFW